MNNDDVYDFMLEVCAIIFLGSSFHIYQGSRFYGLLVVVAGIIMLLISKSKKYSEEKAGGK